MRRVNLVDAPGGTQSLGGATRRRERLVGFAAIADRNKRADPVHDHVGSPVNPLGALDAMALCKGNISSAAIEVMERGGVTRERGRSISWFRSMVLGRRALPVCLRCHLFLAALSCPVDD
jgi:hypothetical protein